MFNLKNKKILIVGGSGLIGKETTKLFLNHGAHVVNIDLKNLGLKNKKYNYFKIDITKSNSTDLIKKKVLNYYSPDVFVNCSYPRTSDWSQNSIRNVKKDSFYKNIRFHFDSYIFLTKLACNKMKQNKKGGSIILLSSIYGFLAQNEKMYEKTNKTENVTYSVIKGGIINFAKQLCSYYAKYKIRVNCISPGGIIDNKMSKRFIKNYSYFCPSKRLGKPKEVAEAILFLASDGSSYINGTNLVIDGGYSSV